MSNPNFHPALAPVSGSYFEPGKLPRFMTCAELSKKLESRGLFLKPAKIQELCEAGKLPCFYFGEDRFNPLFHWDNVQHFISEGMLSHQRGQPLKIDVVVPPGNSSVPQNVPGALSAMEGLYEFKDPTVPCVYFLCDGGEITYVGKTINLPSRILSHREEKKFQQCFFILVPRSELDSVESQFIKLFQPRDNKAGIKRPGSAS